MKANDLKSLSIKRQTERSTAMTELAAVTLFKENGPTIFVYSKTVGCFPDVPTKQRLKYGRTTNHFATDDYRCLSAADNR
ncbi:hypothetical protein DPMN_038027 [Dreissena polymorpha]|uniref:Uncharacterized protein n=1 Tax=Dreissena polymorpha TaxID=45954 RepID=A0A9D4MEN3_DREPO|nr:hypothetical protein DPMN_038027 [Dreissena polymorpha]